LAQAFRLAETRNGPINTWEWSNGQTIIDILKPHLNVTKICSYGETGCWAEKSYNLHNDEYSMILPGSLSIILSNGIFVNFHHGAYQGCTGDQTDSEDNKYLNNVCSEIYIDINGMKKPNVMGKDIFTFWSTKYGLYPMGTKDERYWYLPRTCQPNGTFPNNGGGCTAWLIEKGNMDYLHKQIQW